MIVYVGCHALLYSVCSADLTKQQSLFDLFSRGRNGFNNVVMTIGHVTTVVSIVTEGAIK